MANRSQPRHQEEEKREREKKSRAKQTRMHEKYIDQLPPPQTRPIGLFCYLLSLHTLYNRGLVQTRPWKGMVQDPTVNKSLY